MLAEQDYNELRSQHLRNKTLFEDPEFPARGTSVYFSKRARDIEWKRPKELVENPQFFVEGASRFDVNQGELGDCWLMAAIANLTLNESYFQRVVPQDQNFSDGSYAGIFHFRFWQYDHWIDVVIDDLLPTKNGELQFLRSKQPNEFWSALLEKAYAKLHGSYEALSGGLPYEALLDFTGGVAETYHLKNPPPRLFQILLESFRKSSLMCSYILKAGFRIEAKGPMGLINRHAYSITCIKQVELNDHGKVQMIRLRNPWGTEAEWKGPWSDRSQEWKNVPIEEKRAVGLTFDADGEFWMSFSDFILHFTDVEIVNLATHERSDRFVSHLLHSKWTKGLSAGGNLSYRGSYHQNPQFRFRLPQNVAEQGGNCCVLVSLMREYNRRQRRNNIDELWIGFQVFHVEDEHEGRLDQAFFQQNEPVYDSDFTDSREVARRIQLKVPATYFIVPCTFKPKAQANFILRIYFDKEIEVRILEDAPKQPDETDCCTLN